MEEIENKNYYLCCNCNVRERKDVRNKLKKYRNHFKEIEVKEDETLATCGPCYSKKRKLSEISKEELKNDIWQRENEILKEEIKELKGKIEELNNLNKQLNDHLEFK